MTKYRATRRWLFLGVLSLVVAMVALACAEEPTATRAPVQSTAAPELVMKTRVIKFGDTQFQTLWIDNAVAGYIINHGYGYPAETIELTTPLYQSSLPIGEIDIEMELWRSNILAWYNEEIEAGRIIDVGQLYEASRQGWYVPTYMIEGDTERGIEATAPDLVSVFDLVDPEKEYWKLFEDPEDPSKGVWVNCIIGWQCQKKNRISAKVYGWDEFYNVIEPGAAAGIDAAIAGAYQRGEPFLSYYWEPTWIVGAYKMTYIEEPPYTLECNNKIQEQMLSQTPVEDLPTLDESCAYEVFDIHKGVWAGLQQDAPEVVAFLEKMFFGNKVLNDLAGYMELEEKTADETAIYFFQTYEDLWTQWVPADVEAFIKAAIADGKVGFSAF